MSRNLKKQSAIVFLLAFTLFSVLWVYGHSYVEVSVERGVGENRSKYVLQNQKGGNPVIINSAAKNIKKLLPRGSYEITVTQPNGSYFAIVKVQGLLRTSSVSSKLAPEKLRTFVGNNPNPCMNYLEVVLVSYSCGDLFANVNTHVPATATTPTYVVKNQASRAAGNVEGIISTTEGNLLLTKPTAVLEDSGLVKLSHSIQVLQSDLQVMNQTRLDNLDKDSQYSLAPFKSGFLVYKDNLQDIYYYTSSKSNPQQITIDKPNAKQLEPKMLTSKSSSIATLFSTTADTDKKKSKSELIISENNRSIHYEFDKKIYAGGQFCGTQKICLLGSEKEMDVYDISTQKAKFVFSIVGVLAIESSNGQLLAVNKDGVLNIDVDSQSGFMEYSFGDYRFNNIAVDNGIYVLSLTNNKNRKVALLIDRKSVNAGSIDKKVEGLQKMSEVSFVSIYDKFIYISADLGALVYDSSKKGYTYNPETKKNVAEKINKEIDKLGIDRQVYTITGNAF